MNFSLQDKPCSNQMADSRFPTAVISYFYSAVHHYRSVLVILRLWSLVRIGSFQMDLRMYTECMPKFISKIHQPYA